MNNDSGGPIEARGSYAGRRKNLLWIVVAVIVAALVVTVVVFAFNGGAEPASSGSSAAVPSSSEPGSTASATGDGDADPSSPAPEPETRISTAPMTFGDEAEPRSGIAVSVASIESVDGEAVLPGEVSGPALSVTVVVSNSTSDALNLSTAVVTLFYGADQLGASPISKPAGAAFPSDVQPGDSATGTFVFEVPADARAQVRIEVDLSVADPIVVFQGSVQ